MTKENNRKSGFRRFLETSFFVLGVAGISIFAWTSFSEVIYEDWQSWALDQQVAGRPADLSAYLHARMRPAEKPDNAAATRDADAGAAMRTVPAPGQAAVVPATRPTNNQLLGRLSIARLNVRAVVREGTTNKTLSLALGHILGTALPGQNGNIGIAGHRDALFRGLRNVKTNDRVVFEGGDGSTYTYRVESMQIVKPTEVSVLNAGTYPELTLITCYPFDYIGAAPKRFIVKARQTSQETSEAAISEISSNQPPSAIIQPKEPKVLKASHQEPALKPSNNMAAPSEARSSVRGREEIRRVIFEVGVDRSQLVAPGVWVGLNSPNDSHNTAEGWVRISPNRMIHIPEHSVQQPVFFTGYDGKERQLVILSVSANSMRGYLLVQTV